MQQHAVGLDTGKRHKRGDGHLEAQQVDELVDGFRQDAVGAEGDPAGRASQRKRDDRSGARHAPEESKQHAGRLQPA